MSTRRSYETRTEAVLRLIVEPIEATGIVKASEYDIDEIADRVLLSTARGYRQCVDVTTFWQVVEANEKGLRR